MTTNPDVLKLARSIADAAVPDVNADHPEQTTRRVIWDQCRLSAIAAIERTTQLAGQFVRDDDGKHLHRTTAWMLERYDHLRQQGQTMQTDDLAAQMVREIDERLSWLFGVRAFGPISVVEAEAIARRYIKKARKDAIKRAVPDIHPLALRYILNELRKEG